MIHNWNILVIWKYSTVKLGDKERFDKEQIGVKEPFCSIFYKVQIEDKTLQDLKMSKLDF